MSHTRSTARIGYALGCASPIGEVFVAIPHLPWSTLACAHRRCGSRRIYDTGHATPRNPLCSRVSAGTTALALHCLTTIVYPVNYAQPQPDLLGRHRTTPKAPRP